MNEFQELVLTKYQHDNESWEEICERMSRAVNQKDAVLGAELKDYFLDHTLMPQGSILFGLGVPGIHPDWGDGNKMTISLSNCVVQTIREDSMDDIMLTGARAAKCYQYRMGVGTDLSKLRPRGTKVHNAAKTSSGAASFMQLMSTICGTIGQQGRRGALMLTIDIDHPDVEEFIKMKMDSSKVLNANISVKISDDFMRAVINEDTWELQWPTRYERQATGETDYEVYKVVSARKVWNDIVQCAYESAEPGILFWDRMLERPAAFHAGSRPVTTNPCSEIPIPDDDVCLLTSIYLPNFVKNPYTPKAKFDFKEFQKVIKLGVRFLDIVKTYDTELVPYEDIAKKSEDFRRVGLGTHGLGDTFWRMGFAYGSPESVKLTDLIYSVLCNESYRESIQLAKECGPYYCYDKEETEKCDWLKEVLYSEVYQEMLEYGRRNVQLNTIAPTGSVSALSNNCSSGIEPAFDYEYDRFCLGRQLKEIPHGEFEIFKEITGETEPRDYMKVSTDLTPEDRVAVQAAASKYLDHSCSSTVNFLAGTKIKDVEDVYFLAWSKGCQGITVYVDGSREGIVTLEGQKVIREQKIGAYSYRFGSKYSRNYITVGLGARDEPIEVLVSNQDPDFNFGIDDTLYKLKELAMSKGLLRKLWTIDERNPLDQKMSIYVSILLRHRVSINRILQCFEGVIAGTLPYQIKTALRLSLPESMRDVTCVKGQCE